MFSGIKKFFASQKGDTEPSPAAQSSGYAASSPLNQGSPIEMPIGEAPPEYAEEDKDFMAIHFEGLGNAWAAVFGESSEGITQCLPWVLAEGTLKQDCQVIYKEDKKHIALLQAPAAGDIQAATLLVKTEQAKNMEVWSGYPVLQGIPNNLVINKTHTWSNGVEGVVSAHAANDGPPVTFFAPFYFRDFMKFAPGATLSISLGALAFKISKAEANPFTISEGPFYEMRLAEFLKENPEKTKEDFPHVEVSYAGARVLLPAAYACEWTFRCPVLGVEQTKLMDTRFVKISTEFVGLDDEVIRGFLYASEHVLNGYAPQPGDDVEGVLWMTGSIAPSEHMP